VRAALAGWRTEGRERKKGFGSSRKKEEDYLFN